MNPPPLPDCPGAPEQGRPVRRSLPLLRAVWAGSLAVVVAGSLLPASSAPMRAVGMLRLDDKAAHMAAYAALAALASLYESGRVLGWITVGLLATACLLEVVQRCCCAGRTFEVPDILGGAAGLAAGLALGLASRAWLVPSLRGGRHPRIPV